MAMEKGRSTWMCISCGYVLGNIFGGELNIDGHVKKVRTSGANLIVYCPECGAQKTFYTSDPIVRAIYQLVTAMSDVTAKATVEAVGHELNKK